MRGNKAAPCLPNKQRQRQAQPCPHHNKQTDATKEKSLQPLPHSATLPIVFFPTWLMLFVRASYRFQKFCLKGIFWLSQMSNESKHPSHALHSAKMVFGPIMETTMKYSGFDPNYLAGFEEKTALKLWAITCRGSWSPFDLKTHQNADTIVINLLIKPWMPHFCVSINSANPAWGFSTFISVSRQREKKRQRGQVIIEWEWYTERYKERNPLRY